MNRAKFEATVVTTWMWIVHEDKNLRWHGRGQMHMLNTLLFSSGDVDQDILNDMMTLSALADKVAVRMDMDEYWNRCKEIAA